MLSSTCTPRLTACNHHHTHLLAAECSSRHRTVLLKGARLKHVGYLQRNRLTLHSQPASVVEVKAEEAAISEQTDQPQLEGNDLLPALSTISLETTSSSSDSPTASTIPTALPPNSINVNTTSTTSRSHEPVVASETTQPAQTQSPTTLLSKITDSMKKLLYSKHDAEIWALALPALAAMLLEPIIGVINAGLMGHVGTQQLSAVSMGSLAVSFCSFLFAFLLFLTTPEIAGAVSQKDDAKVSRIASKGLWLACILGVATSAFCFFAAPSIVLAQQPPEAAVAEFATTFIQVRAFSILPSLLGFVAIGTFRGFKDTRTPLISAAASGLSSLALNVLFVVYFHWGVFGAGLASTLAQVVSCSYLWFKIISSGKLRPHDILHPPPMAEFIPMLKMGSVLALRNIISFGMILYASSLCVRAGSTSQASFEIIRQVWILTIQFFECLNVATQAMCASYLGSKDTETARSVIQRILTLGMAVGLVVGLVLFVFRDPAIAVFTKDAEVIHQVMLAFPLICLCFPLDAAASIMDGGLMAAQQTNYLSLVQIVGAVFQYAFLSWVVLNDAVGVLSIWACLKLLTFFRLGGGFVRNFMSSKSAYSMKLKLA